MQSKKLCIDEFNNLDAENDYLLVSKDEEAREKFCDYTSLPTSID